MKQWQAAGLVVALLVIVYGMNALNDYRDKRAKAEAQAVKEAKMKAEFAAAEKIAPNIPPHSGPATFKLPPNTGPQDAPIKLEVFVNSANACHSVGVTLLATLEKIYGKLVRVEWKNMKDPNVARKADELAIGCEAALLINGAIERNVQRTYGGKALVDFRGPIGNKYRVEDVYASINEILTQKGIAVPPAASEKALAAGGPPSKAH